MDQIGSFRKVREEDWPQLYSLCERVLLRKDETHFLKKIKQDGDVAACYVLERNGEINAFILYSRVKIVDEQDESFIENAVVLGPIIVDTIWQGKGIGSKLIAHAHHKIRQEQECLAFVLGEEEYYARFGFSADLASSYKSPYSGPYLLGCKWSDDIPQSGKLIYPAAFAELSA